MDCIKSISDKVRIHQYKEPNYFSDEVSIKDQLHYKCIESKIPKSKFAVFVETNEAGQKTDIEFKYEGQDSMDEYYSDLMMFKRKVYGLDKIILP